MTDKKKAEKSSSIDKQLIRDLADLLSETGLTEIEIEHKDLRVRVARGAATTSPPAPVPPPISALPQTSSGGDSQLANQPGTVISPMVGTVYRAPEPDAANFVEVRGHRALRVAVGDGRGKRRADPVDHRQLPGRR